jgi:hypothetical protein
MTTSSAILVGYFCDVTGELSPESIAVLSTSGCSRVFVDSQSSSGTELKKAVEALRPGDTLLVPKLDSLGMNLRAMMAFIVRLSAEGFTSGRQGKELIPAKLSARLTSADCS